MADASEQTGHDTAELTCKNPPDFDRPAGSNRHSIYELTARAQDGRHYRAFCVIVTVEAVGAAPDSDEDNG